MYICVWICTHEGRCVGDTSLIKIPLARIGAWGWGKNSKEDKEVNKTIKQKAKDSNWREFQ